jgi:hypothetical protein
MVVRQHTNGHGQRLQSADSERLSDPAGTVPLSFYRGNKASASGLDPEGEADT